MGNLNKVLLIGRICQDVEKKSTPTGNFVCNNSLATTEYYKDKNGNRQENSQFHNIVAWNNIADIMERFCKKGSEIFVEGSLQTRDWQDKDGNKRYTTEIIVKSIQLLGPKQHSQQSQQHDPYGPPR